MRRYEDVQVLEKAVGHAGVESVTIQVRLGDRRIVFTRNIPKPCDDCGKESPGDPWCQVSRKGESGEMVDVHLCEECTESVADDLFAPLDV